MTKELSRWQWSLYLTFLQPCTDISLSIALWLTRRGDYMTGLVQTSSEGPRSRVLSPLIVSRLQIYKGRGWNNFIVSWTLIVKRLKRRHNDPGIIEMRIFLVLDPSSDMCRFAISICNLTNKAVGTSWRALFKPTQRQQDPEICPLWLLVGNPTINPCTLARVKIAVKQSKFMRKKILY